MAQSITTPKRDRTRGMFAGMRRGALLIVCHCSS
jgi:hypothetical protein